MQRSSQIGAPIHSANPVLGSIRVLHAIIARALRFRDIAERHMQLREIAGAECCVSPIFLNGSALESDPHWRYGLPQPPERTKDDGSLVQYKCLIGRGNASDRFAPRPGENTSNCSEICPGRA
jgi:hypothetical protein